MKANFVLVDDNFKKPKKLIVSDLKKKEEEVKKDWKRRKLENRSWTKLETNCVWINIMNTTYSS